MNVAQKELDTLLNDLKEKFHRHVSAYLANVETDLKNTIENMKHDYSEDDNADLIIPREAIDRIFLTGKRAMLDTMKEFYSEDIPDHEFDSEYDLAECFEYVDSEMQNHLREDGEEDISYLAECLKLSYERLNLGVLSEIDEIIKTTDKLIEAI